MTAFTEKPRGDGGLINGGFFVLSPRCLDLIEGDDSSLEELADHPARGHGADDGVRASRVLAGDGHVARQDHAGRALGIRQGAMEDLALTGAMNASFWRGKRVLLTGHTGFKGAWLTLWLHRLGAEVTGISLPPATDAQSLHRGRASATLCQSHFCDIRDAAALAELVRKPRSRRSSSIWRRSRWCATSYREPRATFATNVMGTVHVLEALRGLDERACGGDGDDRQGLSRRCSRPSLIARTIALGGQILTAPARRPAKSSSPAIATRFLPAQGVAVASARAGNVIGGGDWSEDRLIPDAVRAWQAGRTLDVRRPQAVRPWQHVLEPLAGYLTLAQQAVGAAGAGRRL